MKTDVAGEVAAGNIPAPLAAAVDADFPGWHAWSSDDSRWWATRTGATAQWHTDRLPMTVDADDEAGLRAELAGLTDAAERAAFCVFAARDETPADERLEEETGQAMTELSAGLEPPAFDVTVPHVARIYDYLLNGKDNYAVDRAAAARLLEEIPHAAEACRENRAFLGRVVREFAARGIGQFLDIGSGLPTVESVHEVAKTENPDCRVVYVDNDPVVLAHARATLANTADDVYVVPGDVRDPARIIDAAEAHLNFSEPVAVLCFAVLHFMTDGDDPHAIARILTRPLVPGSAIAVSHITADGTDPERSKAAQQVYQGASAPAVPRPLADVERFFTGLTLLPPGVVDIRRWGLRKPALGGTPLTFYGGAALVPGVER